MMNVFIPKIVEIKCYQCKSYIGCSNDPFDKFIGCVVTPDDRGRIQEIYCGQDCYEKSRPQTKEGQTMNAETKQLLERAAKSAGSFCLSIRNSPQSRHNGNNRAEKQAIARGEADYLSGKGENPYIYLSKYKALASWWEVGRQKAELKQKRAKQ